MKYIFQPKAQQQALLLEHVSCDFNGLQALSDVSLSVSRGEVLGLIGPNGSGKTTLFNLITGVYAPTTGRILFNGQVISGLRPHLIALSGITRTFQNPQLFESLTVWEHIVVAMNYKYKIPSIWNLLRQAGVPSRQRVNEARAILEQVGLQDEMHLMASSLPYGKRRLLELAKCLAARAQQLLLDEPTAGLNEQEQNVLQDRLNNVVQNFNLSMIIIDHNMSFLRMLCPRLVALSSGNKICDGDVEDVLSDPQLSVAYLGEK